MESFTKFAGLDDAVALVTGGATGIGSAIVENFLRQGRRQVERWLTPELEQVVLDGQCLKRLVEPEDVAKMVAFLASEDARSCTNQTFVIDAGWL